jgi:hypothetical protein
MIRQSLTESISQHHRCDIFVEIKIQKDVCFGRIDVNREMGIRQNRLILIISVVERSMVEIANSLDMKAKLETTLSKVASVSVSTN